MLLERLKSGGGGEQRGREERGGANSASSPPIESNAKTICQQQQQQLAPIHCADIGSVNLHALSKSPVIAVADWHLHGGELAAKYAQNEIILRNKLAAFYRLTDVFQWSQGVYNHITVRVSEGTSNETVEILINPFGLLYQEVTATSLVKIDLAGRVLDPGSAHMAINQAAYVLHSAIHEARPDVRCVVHLHTPVVAAVSAMKCGLLAICQEAMVVGPVAYHHYQGIVSDANEKQSLVQSLGDKNVMILHNHGFVVCGESVEDALHLTFHLVLACQTQLRAIRSSGGLENLIIPDASAVEKAYRTTRRAGGGGVLLVSSKSDANNDNGAQSGASAAPPVAPAAESGASTISWAIGELEWEAWMRVLDSTGYCTGHIYKMPNLKNWHCHANANANFALANSNNDHCGDTM